MLKFEGIDLFAGAGGTTTGIERAKYAGKKIAEVIACINHDEVAIQSHAANHKNVVHFTEDIKNFDVTKFPKFTDSPDVITYIWASLECTNFSNAKGGLSRDEDSRTLANHLFRYIEHLKTDYILIENVKEFKEWGPLIQKRNKVTGELMFDKKGKPMMVPDLKHKREFYNAWVEKVKSYGYEYEPQMINSANLGADTSRNRLFIVFARYGMPTVWPESTHSKIGGNGLKKYRAVKNDLDFSDKGENIFGRKKDLCENTYKRIFAGLIKFVAKGDKGFINQYNTAGDDRRVYPLDTCCNTITTSNRFSLIQPEFFINYNHSSEANSIEEPAPTFLTHDKIGLVQPEFLIKYHGRGENVLSIEEPASTLSTKDRLGVISTEHFIDMQHGQGKQNQSVDEPCGAVLPVVKKNLVTVEQLSFLDQQYGMSKPADLEEPCNTLTANPKYNLVQAFLMNPQYSSKGSDIENPCFTLIARMDKRPPYLIQIESGEFAIKVEDNDSEYMRKIKLFMAAYGIVAIYMRMLRIPELLRIQGLGDDYILCGTQAQQKKFIGNAVVPIVPKRMIESLYRANLNLRNQLEQRKAI